LTNLSTVTRFPRGTVGAPSITFDTNSYISKQTGFYQSATNNIDIAISGINVLNIDNNRNINFTNATGSFRYRNRFSCKIVRNTTLSVSNITWTQLTGCVITDGGFDTSTSSDMNSSDRITIRQSGIYKIIAYGKTGSNITTSIRIFLNGPDPITDFTANRLIQGISLGSTIDDSYICVENICSLTNNDVLRVYYYQNSGTTQNLGSSTANALADYLSLEVIYLGQT
jgi:hypothetical protein